MGDGSKIEWCDASWNPVVGCQKVSKGCAGCYAIRSAARLQAMGMRGYAGVVADGRWTGRVNVVESALEIPLRWKRPRVVFVDSMGDLLHEDVPDGFLDRVFGVMALAAQHEFIVLTKRAERLGRYLRKMTLEALRAAIGEGECLVSWPLSNVVIGVSVEDQATAAERLPYLLGAPACRRVVSCEPLLGPVRLDRVEAEEGTWYNALTGEWSGNGEAGPRLNGVIVGGESGPGARPMHPDWARALRDQCKAAGVRFFFKQWGEWAPYRWQHASDLSGGIWLWPDGHQHECLGSEMPSAMAAVYMRRLGKKRAGRALDGELHDELCWGLGSGKA